MLDQAVIGAVAAPANTRGSFWPVAATRAISAAPPGLALLGALAAARFLFLALAGYALDWSALALDFLVIAAPLVGLIYLTLRFDAPLLRLLLQGVLLFHIATIGSYEIAMLIFHIGRDVPLADPALALADAWFGFYWPRYAHAALARYDVALTLAYAYESISYQPWIIGAALVLHRRSAVLYEMAIAFGVALALTWTLGAFAPSVGAHQHFLDHVQDLPRLFGTHQELGRTLMKLRAGDFDPRALTGVPIVQFPSFHTACAVIYALAGWRTALRWGAVSLNLLMLAATPIGGSHYLVDMIAGAAIALIAVWVARIVVRRSGDVQ